MDYREKNFLEPLVYESVDDKSLSYLISQKSKVNIIQAVKGLTKSVYIYFYSFN